MSTGKLNEQAKGVYIIAATPFTDEGAVDLGGESQRGGETHRG